MPFTRNAIISKRGTALPPIHVRCRAVSCRNEFLRTLLAILERNEAPEISMCQRAGFSCRAFRLGPS